MERKQHIRKSHENLSTLNLRFLDHASKTPDCLKADNYYLLELNDPLFKLQPWPTFINRETKRKITEASLKVLKLIKRIPSQVFSNDSGKISRYYGINPSLSDYFLYGLTDNHLDNLLSRGDFIFTSSGLKCVEFNINTNLGGMDLSSWGSRYLATPVISEFIDRYRVKINNKNLHSVLIEHLLDAAGKFYTESDEINIAIVLPQGTNNPRKDSQEMYFNSLLNTLLNVKKSCLKGKVFICDYLSLEVTGEDVFFQGNKIHCILEWCQGFVPDRILDIFKRGKILICNGAIAFLLSTKLNLALLSENKDSGLFSPGDRATIETYIPWTRRIIRGETDYEGMKVKLEEFIISNRENLVLKPLLGTGGKDIYVGRYTPKEEWQKVVETAFLNNNWRDIIPEHPLTEKKWYQFSERALSVKGWIVQEYIESSKYLYQWGESGCAEHHAVWGFFIFGDLYAGGWVRLLPTSNKSGIINCHQGARVSVIFEVD